MIPTVPWRTTPNQDSIGSYKRRHLPWHLPSPFSGPDFYYSVAPSHCSWSMAANNEPRAHCTLGAFSQRDHCCLHWELCTFDVHSLFQILWPAPSIGWLISQSGILCGFICSLSEKGTDLCTSRFGIPSSVCSADVIRARACPPVWMDSGQRGQSHGCPIYNFNVGWPRNIPQRAQTPDIVG